MTVVSVNYLMTLTQTDMTVVSVNYLITLTQTDMMVVSVNYLITLTQTDIDSSYCQLLDNTDRHRHDGS